MARQTPPHAAGFIAPRYPTPAQHGWTILCTLGHPRFDQSWSRHCSHSMEAGGSISTNCLDPRRLLPRSSPWPSYHSHQSGCLQGHSLVVPDLRASASLHPQSPGGFPALLHSSPTSSPLLHPGGSVLWPPPGNRPSECLGDLVSSRKPQLSRQTHGEEPTP